MTNAPGSGRPKPYTEHIVSHIRFIYGLYLTYPRTMFQGTDIPGWMFIIGHTVKSIVNEHMRLNNSNRLTSILL